MRRLRKELASAAPGQVARPLAASVGLAGGAVPGPGDVLPLWVEQADAALMRAKALGRNRIEIADEAVDLA
jgi:PleD family two-component response regulator